MTDPMSTAASTLGEPVTIPFAVQPCVCVRRHVPHPRFNHLHHIIPLAWGGTDAPDNVVALCPSSHENIHMTLRRWVKAGHPTRTNFTPYVLDLTMRAWESHLEHAR